MMQDLNDLVTRARATSFTRSITMSKAKQTRLQSTTKQWQREAHAGAKEAGGVKGTS